MRFVFFYITTLLGVCSLIKNAAASRTLQDCVCGVANEPEIDVRIINGHTTFPHQFPWIVYLAYKGMSMCGGGLINTRYIVTAAHCVYHLQAKYFTVVLGAHNRTGDGQVSQVSQIIIHPQYTRYVTYDDFDIAMVRLKEPVTFNDFVKPICLPNPKSDYTDVLAVIAGWGTLADSYDIHTARMPTTLMTSSVRILASDYCQLSKSIGSKILPEQNLCAYSFETDTCKGDSGSPLVYEVLPYKYEMIGVVSWGVGCAIPKIPGVYVRVTYFIDWIAKHTRDADYCRIK